MPFTYTYTARNKDNPNRVATFTIFDDEVKVNLTGIFDQVSDVMDEEKRKEAVKEIISTQSGTALYKLTERLSGPAHINDVTPIYNDEKLIVTFWKRLKGLRFAPVVLSMGPVDNPEAASQFVEILKDRQEQADAPGFFAGPLDYWATWIAALIGLVVLLRWPRKQKSK